MTPSIESKLQELGAEVIAVCGCEPISAAVYVEAEDGAVSASVFFTKPASEKAHFKFGGPRVSGIAHAIWQEWHSSSTKPVWRAFTYKIEDGKFSVEFVYPDQFDEQVPKSQRRLAAVASVIQGKAVDYATP